MFQQIEQALKTFRSCFTRKAAFGWFVVIIIGLIVRPDLLGVTSIIRGLSLDPGCYEKLLHFFRSDAWTPGRLRAAWYGYLQQKAPVYKACGRTVLAGDGVKQSKEAFFMPGVKKMVQESEDSSKGEFIFGHLFGAVGVIAGEQAKKILHPPEDRPAGWHTGCGILERLRHFCRKPYHPDGTEWL